MLRPRAAPPVSSLLLSSPSPLKMFSLSEEEPLLLLPLPFPKNPPKKLFVPSSTSTLPLSSETSFFRSATSSLRSLISAFSALVARYPPAKPRPSASSTISTGFQIEGFFGGTGFASAAAGAAFGSSFFSSAFAGSSGFTSSGFFSSGFAIPQLLQNFPVFSVPQDGHFHDPLCSAALLSSGFFSSSIILFLL